MCLFVSTCYSQQIFVYDMLLYSLFQISSYSLHKYKTDLQKINKIFKTKYKI